MNLIREYVREVMLQEQAGKTIAELITKVPMKALVKVMKKGLGNLKASAKMGMFYAKGNNFQDLTRFMAEKMKDKKETFTSEDEVLKYIDENADELIQYAVDHYNEKHPKDEPVKLEHVLNRDLLR